MFENLQYLDSCSLNMSLCFAVSFLLYFSSFRGVHHCCSEVWSSDPHGGGHPVPAGWPVWAARVSQCRCWSMPTESSSEHTLCYCQLLYNTQRWGFQDRAGARFSSASEPCALAGPTCHCHFLKIGLLDSAIIIWETVWSVAEFLALAFAYFKETHHLLCSVAYWNKI